MIELYNRLGILYIFSQTCAILSIIVFALSYILKNKNFIFFFQTLGNLLVVLSFVFLKDIVGSISTGIASIRSGCFYFYSKKGKEMPWFLVIIFIVLTLVSPLISDITFLTFLYCFGLSIFTLSMKFFDVIKMKFGFLIANIIYFIYSYFIGNYFNAVGKAIQIISIIASLSIYFISKKNDKKNHNLQI